MEIYIKLVYDLDSCSFLKFILQKQLEELRHKMGATLSDRYVSHQKGTAKVVADHDKLRKDLMKVNVEAFVYS